MPGQAAVDLGGEEQHVHEDQDVGGAGWEGEQGSVGVDEGSVGGDGVPQHLERQVYGHDPIESGAELGGHQAGGCPQLDDGPSVHSSAVQGVDEGQ